MTGLVERYYKQSVGLVTDALALPFALWCAIALRLGEIDPDVAEFGPLFLVAPLVCLPVFTHLGLYRAVIRYVDTRAIWTIAQGVAAGAVALPLAAYFMEIPGFPRSVPFIFGLLALVYVGGTRFAFRAWYQRRFPDEERRPTILWGAGEAGVALLGALQAGGTWRVLAFVDDDADLQGRSIRGVRVHAPDDLQRLLEEGDVRDVMLAVPSADAESRRRMLQILARFPLRVRTMPDLADLDAGRAGISDIRDLDVRELLGREPVPPRRDLLQRAIRERVVMVTGAGGSIGSELCRQIIALQPRALVMYELSEYALYRIEQDIARIQSEFDEPLPVQCVLGTVQDREQLEAVIRARGVQTIYHAAAYKHVNSVERNVAAGVRNNALGTLAVVEAAEACGVERCVLVSTDKAVRSTSVMGASKRLAEQIVQARALLAGPGAPVWSVVRFGNVLGSSGSVVPLFRRQIRAGGPVTVTHPEVERFFMSIEEAVGLVIQAGAMAEPPGGDLFVLEMGEPVRIAQLARAMIHLMGHEVRDAEHPGGDIEIRYIGLAPGEKLTEELLATGPLSGTEHPAILRAYEEGLAWPELAPRLEELAEACARLDDVEVRRQLQRLVSGASLDGSRDGGPAVEGAEAVESADARAGADRPGPDTPLH